MAKKRYSAGLLPYRVRDGRVEFFLVHPGGPFWVKKDDGAWSIAKGEYEPGEDALEVARREFKEETGFEAGTDPSFIGEVKQPGGKLVTAWMFEGSYDPEAIRSNVFALEWPRGSGKRQRFPEVDRAGWFDYDAALKKILIGQRPLVEQAREWLEAQGLRVADGATGDAREENGSQGQP